jgi:hypothetical protein
MEIISYVVDGGLQHRDSLGTGSVIRPGEVQRMTAGRGVSHSEFNASKSDPVHFLQIWVTPEATNLTPSYAQKYFDPALAVDGRTLLVSPRGEDGSIDIHQDVRLYRQLLQPGQSVVWTSGPNRYAWIQVVQGKLDLGDVTLQAGDGAAVVHPATLSLRSDTGCEALLFDLP